jgi:hypothetical protein
MKNGFFSVSFLHMFPNSVLLYHFVRPGSSACKDAGGILSATQTSKTPKHICHAKKEMAEL